MTCKDLVIKNHPNSHDREGENSYEFAKKIKSLKLPPGTKMYSFDAEALYPSIPIADCIKEILRQLKEDETLKNRTNLTSDDIADLISLCLETTDFVYNNRHNTTNDSGPIGLSLMVYIAQIWMIYTIKQAVKLAEEKKYSHSTRIGSLHGRLLVLLHRAQLHSPRTTQQQLQH